MADDSDSPRDVELSSLSAIYPEIQQLRPDDPYTITLDIPVNPSTPVTVFFPAAADDALPPGANGAPNGTAAAGPVDSHELAHLPSVHLEIALGPQYPAEQPPQIAISTNPPWLPAERVKQLEDDAPRLWEEMGRDIVGFTYIDHVQQAADDVFGLVDAKGALEVDPRHKIAILDYDIRARKAAFEKDTFDCGVCLEPKKGSACHRMLDCGHVFCVACLQDFYNNAITEGDIAAVRCLAPNCAKERSKAAASPSGRKRKKPRTFINPSELLQIPLDQETVKRYVTLKYKTELESDKNTVYCPRPWCNGAARSKKHRKPQGLELASDASDDDTDSDSSASDDEADDNNNNDAAQHPPEDNNAAPKPRAKPPSSSSLPPEDLLSICTDCAFAFCARCAQSWHGPLVRCAPRRDAQELTAEEKASLEYLRLHTTPCPTCAAPAQKTHGCNHMICYRCQSHFCYLCSAWLDPGNPYQHFNEGVDGRVTGCYMRLWELEGGDGDDVGIGYAGGGGVAVARAPQVNLPVPVQEVVIQAGEVGAGAERDGQVRGGGGGGGGRQGGGAVVQQQQQQQQGEAHVNGGQVGIAREGPLVLRIAANPPPPAPAGGAHGRQPAAAAAPAQLPVRGGGGGAARGGRNQQLAPRGGGPPQQHHHQQAGRAAAGAGAGAAQRGGRPGAGGGAAGQRGRGRGGGGGGGGPAAAGGAAHRQNNNINVNNNQPANQADRAALRRNADQDGGVAGGGGELDPRHQEWVRQFVLAALNDEEDILFEDDFDDI